MLIFGAVQNSGTLRNNKTVLAREAQSFQFQQIPHTHTAQTKKRLHNILSFVDLDYFNRWRNIRCIQ